MGWEIIYYLTVYCAPTLKVLVYIEVEVEIAFVWPTTINRLEKATYTTTITVLILLELVGLVVPAMADFTIVGRVILPIDQLQTDYLIPVRYVRTS